MTDEAIVDYVLGLDVDNLDSYLTRDLMCGGVVAQYKVIELYGGDAFRKVYDRLVTGEPYALRALRATYITHLLHRKRYVMCPYEEATHIRTIDDNAAFEFLPIVKESDNCVRLSIVGIPKVSPQAVEILLGPNCWFKECYADVIFDKFVREKEQLASFILKVMDEPDEDQIVYHRIYQINPKASTPNTEHKWCAQIFDVHYGPFDSYKEALDFRPSKMAQPGEVIRTPRGLRRITGTTPLNDGQIVLTAELYELAGYPIPKDCVLAQFDNKLCAVRLSQGTQGQQRGIRYIFRQRDSHKFEWASDGQYDLTHVVDLSDTPARTTWDLLPDIIKEVVL